MKKIKKIKIKLNGKVKQIPKDFKIDKLTSDLKIPYQGETTGSGSVPSISEYFSMG